MNQVRSRARQRQVWGIVALAGLLALTSLMLTQCRFVSDSVSGVDITANSLCRGADCVRGCEERFRSAWVSEEFRHVAALKQCRVDKACRKAEDAKHDAIVDGLQRALKDCKKHCYNEGGGHGGR